MFEQDRRKFIRNLGIAAVAVIGSGGSSLLAQTGKETHIPMFSLPYELKALEPYISAKTVNRHYNTHHLGYFKRLNDYLEANPKYRGIPLKKLIEKTEGGILIENAIYNFAVLLYDHNFYWQSMKKNGGISSEKESILTQRLIDSFGSINKFKEKFVETSMETGVGWTWLVRAGEEVKIIRTDYHDALIHSGYIPLVNIDLWEHAYYIDYFNRREEYIRDYLNHLVNWQFAENNSGFAKR